MIFLPRSIGRTVRSALFASTLAGVGLCLPLTGGAQALKGHNSDAPVNFSADRIEVQDRADRAVLAGNVDVTQADLRLRAARVTVAYTNASALQVQRMIATGGVVVTRGTQRATGDVAVYDLNQRVITMAGRVSLNRNGDVLNGGRLVINLATGLSSVDGRGAPVAGTTSRGGRVSGTFSVPKQNSSP
jgi:lipopolysaccharide export system protein LptA